MTVTLGLIGETQLTAGSFLFWDVGEGNYDLIPSANSIISETVIVNTLSGNVLALPNVGVGIVRRTLWFDLDGDGLRGSWEPPFSGVIVTLDGGPSTTSDPHGHYQFFGVADGFHQLTVSLPVGLEAPDPTFITVDRRGAAVGVAIKIQNDFTVFLPLLNK